MGVRIAAELAARERYELDHHTRHGGVRLEDVAGLCSVGDAICLSVCEKLQKKHAQIQEHPSSMST